MVSELPWKWLTTPVPDYDAIRDPSQERHRRYRQSGRKNERRRDTYEDTYMSRQFVAWDGEGINEDNGSHTYVMLASSLGDNLHDRHGLSTSRVFDLWLACAGDGNIHVGYGLNYDINMILRDVDKDTLYALYTVGRAWWEEYHMEWRGGKSFSVSRVIDGKRRRFLIYDVLPFFQCSFVKACDEYLGDWPHRDVIVAEKARRAEFTYEEIAHVAEYNDYELVTLVRLCDELRTRLNKVDLRVNRWDGPGAIATCLYKKHDIKSFMGTSPDEVLRAAQHGYAGGRFEIIRKGHSRLSAYQYDIRSAYPSAMRSLPCLAHGSWTHTVHPRRVVPFGVYRIEVTGTQVSSTRPQPLWHRNRDGTVYFSDSPHGWYWSPEADIAKNLGNATVHEGWEYHTPCQCDPFRFVEPLYLKRAALKRAGDGAHVGLKLGLNSLYGKLAQQIGWDPGPPLRLPPFHCLEWAGYVTSHCRAQVYRAAMTAPDDIIAFETDAVFSRVPLDVNIGEGLGEWDQTIYADLTYLKSGMYWGTLADGHKCNDACEARSHAVEKTRGINKGSLSRDAVVYELLNGQRKLAAEQTRFITLGQALHQNFDLWTHWVTSPREISSVLWGKRIDVYDRRDNYAMKGDGWHETIGGPHDTVMSYPYEVAWLDGTGGVTYDGMDIEEVRRMSTHVENEAPW